WRVVRNGLELFTDTRPGLSFVPEDEGTYRVELTVTDDDGATATTTRSIVVRDEPAPGQQRVSAAKDSVKCSSSAWTLTVTKAGADAPSRIAVTWADGSRALLG
ncbi:PKD domain-containing protein, partial [Klebsiella pneumoniae]|uniref:PKD domain-containing protein n=1 Tax=Klebsiella pneumoniae TaxID=573 RepID=UPI003A86ABD8